MSDKPMPTICNPVNLPYRYQDMTVLGFFRSVNREGADPSIVSFKDRFYLFMSMCGGFWHSRDLLTWEFAEVPSLPSYDYAPDVRVVDDALVMCASNSTKTVTFYRSSDPLSGEWEAIPGSVKVFDPNLFQDDDGRVYLYSGCSNKTPIWGVELDRNTLQPIGERCDLIQSDVNTRGWERTGVNHNPENQELRLTRVLHKLMGSAPFIEGAWMTKYRGRYYLQYAAPSTQDHTYADGYYLGDSPLGPFSYSPQSPFSSKPGGFMTAAGHGSTFQDQYGNWWHTATMRISKNHMFERRIGLFPAGFDGDGVLFCNQEFADYPMTIPERPADPWSLTAKAMLLSYKRPVKSSSSASEHPAELAVDEDCRSWWMAENAEPGHWLSVDLGEGATVECIQINFADDKLRPKIDKKLRRSVLMWKRYIDPVEHAIEFLLEGSLDEQSWTALYDTRGSGTGLPHDYIVLDTPAAYRYIRLTAYQQPYGAAVAISGLRVFGWGSGQAPTVVVPSVNRVSPLNTMLEWSESIGAQGYNVRYGTAPDKLYKSWLVYDQTHLDLSTLNSGQDYWVAIDAFNANGITRGEAVPIGSA